MTEQLALPRAPRLDDSAALAVAQALCFPDARWDAAVFRSLLALPSVQGLIIATGARIDAFLLLQSDGHEADILTLGSIPEQRRRGLARRLLTSALERLALSGHRRLVLEVATANQAARALYASLGFREVGQRRGYYRSSSGTSDATLLALALPGGTR